MERQHFAPTTCPSRFWEERFLWFGWFGFNAGSALSANELAATAFVTTTVATAAAGLTWALIEWQQNGSPTALGAVTGAVADSCHHTGLRIREPMNAIFIASSSASCATWPSQR